MQKMWGTDSVGRNQIRQKDDFKCNADLWYSGQGGHRGIDRGVFTSLDNLPGEERGVMEPYYHDEIIMLTYRHNYVIYLFRRI